MRGETVRWTKLFLLCLAVALLALAGHWLFSGRMLSWQLAAQINHGVGTIVDLAELAPFDWDRVFFFGPYTPEAWIHKSLGFPWNGTNLTSIEYDDCINLVVFVRGGEVVEWFEHSRGSGDLVELANSTGYARQEARSRVSKAGDRLVLTKEPR
jgi:hypothetical protein